MNSISNHGLFGVQNFIGHVCVRAIYGYAAFSALGVGGTLWMGAYEVGIKPIWNGDCLKNEPHSLLRKVYVFAGRILCALGLAIGGTACLYIALVWGKAAIMGSAAHSITLPVLTALGCGGLGAAVGWMMEPARKKSQWS